MSLGKIRGYPMHLNWYKVNTFWWTLYHFGCMGYPRKKIKNFFCETTRSMILVLSHGWSQKCRWESPSCAGQSANPGSCLFFNTQLRNKYNVEVHREGGVAGWNRKPFESLCAICDFDRFWGFGRKWSPLANLSAPNEPRPKFDGFIVSQKNFYFFFQTDTLAPKLV